MPKHRSFKLDKFVSAVDNELLKVYFTRQGLTIATDKVLDNDMIKKLLDDDIEEELHCINDIADNSRNYLQDAVTLFNIKVEEDETPETTAMKVFLYGDDAFSPVYDQYLYVAYSEKLSHYPFAEGKYNSVKITDFKKEVEQYFKGCGKSENCVIRERTEGDRNIIFIARGDYIRTHSVFKGEQIKTESFRPAKEDMLVFDKKNSVLSLTTSIRGDEEKRKYIEMFGKTIMGLTEVPESTFVNALVSLDPIKNNSFNYSGNENIENVKLTGLCVKQGKAGQIRLTLNAPDITKLLNSYGLSYEGTEFISAKLKFAVKREGKKSKQIPIEIRPPENTRLKERKEKKIIEDYLRENGVMLVGNE